MKMAESVNVQTGLNDNLFSCFVVTLRVMIGGGNPDLSSRNTLRGQGLDPKMNIALNPLLC